MPHFLRFLNLFLATNEGIASDCVEMALQGHVELEKLAYLHAHFISWNKTSEIYYGTQTEISQSAEEQVPRFLESNRTNSRLGVMPQFPRSRSLFALFVHFSSVLPMSSSIHRGYLLAK